MESESLISHTAGGSCKLMKVNAASLRLIIIISSFPYHTKHLLQQGWVYNSFFMGASCVCAYIRMSHKHIIALLFFWNTNLSVKTC